jgi:hypothetical protein
MSHAYQIAPEENEATARFCRTCLQCTQIDTLVSHTMTLAAAEVGLDAIALILTDDHTVGLPSIRVAARGTVAPNVRNRIKAYCTHVIEDITGKQTPSRAVEMNQVTCSLPLHDIKVLTEARILWSIYLGPAERPWGALAFFASRDCGIEPKDLTLLENICPIVEETVERIAGSAPRRQAQHGGIMATIRIDTTEGLSGLSIEESQSALIDEVLFKVAHVLPRGSGLARLGDDTVGILVSADSSSFRENISQTLSEVIANHEAADSIRIEVELAHTMSVEETSTRSVFPTPTNQSSVQLTGVSPVSAAQSG